jgi:hypothetical protein
MTPNFIGTEGFLWFIGRVEDNDDPARLGRVRVRCYGYHTQDKNDLPTRDLPWATTIQPTTSAGLGGIGTSPTGLLPGTQVVGWFADGPVGQMPCVFGVIGGVNRERELESMASVPAPLRQALTTANTAATAAIVRDSDLPPPPPGVSTGELGTLTVDDIQKIKDGIAFRESRGRYAAVNQFGFLGKYQMGALLLIDLQFVNSTYRTNTSLNVDAAWRGKYGVTSKEIFLRNGPAQEAAMDEALRLYYRTLIRNRIIEPSTGRRETAGYLFAMQFGIVRVSAFRAGGDPVDGNGVRVSSYYNAGYNIIT